MNTIKLPIYDTETERPNRNEIVLGYDEITKEWRTVSYRRDSNRFFEHPYTGAVYPIDRMNKWKRNTSNPCEGK